MGKKIEGYFDCTSPYSYFAFTYLRRNRKLLEQYDVEIDINPVFLGGINVGSGNKPPWTLPAKKKYSPYDLKRAIKYFGTEKLSSPDFFPILSIMPQRCMIYVKDHFDRETFEQAFLSTWRYSFVDHINIEKPENMAKCLAEHFSETDVKAIMAAAKTQEYKDKLTANTKAALDRGAFGAPWFWLTNDKGEQEPLFGSDRFAYMWDFLGVPYRDVEIIDKTKARL